MGEVVDVFPVFPLRHAAVVVPTTVPITDAVRIADEERADLMLDAEVDDFARCLVAQVAHAPLGPATHLVFCPLQLLPTARVLLAAALLSGELSELSASLPLEGADAAPGDDKRLARAGRNGGQVDFTQVHGCLDGTGSLLRLRNFETDMQLEAPVPHQGTCPSVLRQGKRQNKGRLAFAHRQHHAPFLPVDGLGGPLDRVERFGAPGVLHAQLRMLPAQFACGLNRAEEGAEDGLHRLAVQGKAPFGLTVQIVLVGPAGVAYSGLPVGLDAGVPHLRCFHLCRFETAEESRRETGQAVDANGFHTFVFFFSARKAVMCRRSGEASTGGRFHPAPWNGAGLPAPTDKFVTFAIAKERDTGYTLC